MGLFSDKKQTTKSSVVNVLKDTKTPEDQQNEQIHRVTDMKASSQHSEATALARPSSSMADAGLGDSPSAVVGSKIKFKGELTGEEDLLIQGKIEGTISLNGFKLTIGKLGTVKADIRAKNIVIDGSVEGDIIADEHIAINASSVVKGNIIAQRVTLEDGAKFRGSIEMDTETTPTAYNSSKPVAAKRPEPETA